MIRRALTFSALAALIVILCSSCGKCEKQDPTLVIDNYYDGTIEYSVSIGASGSVKTGRQKSISIKAGVDISVTISSSGQSSQSVSFHSEYCYDYTVHIVDAVGGGMTVSLGSRDRNDTSGGRGGSGGSNHND